MHYRTIVSLPFLALCLSGALLPGSPTAATLAEARQALDEAYAKQLETLAAQCKEHELAGVAKELGDWLPEREPDKLTLLRLPPANANWPASETGDKSSDKLDWPAKWRGLRTAQAEKLFALAERAVREHQPSLAYQLVVETARENPDHAQARRLLGYVKTKDGWRTPFEVKQLGAGKVWHDKFGWLPKAHVDRYEQGQRNFKGRWVSPEEERSLRADIKQGWRVDSEHYVVTTNDSLEAGVELAQRLETLYCVWQQAFTDYLVSDAELAKWFAGAKVRTTGKQHNVVHFRSRDEYNRALRSHQPQIDITLGIYFAQNRTAYFFAGQDQEPGTLFHEAAHQLFQESRPAVAEVGKSNNFWIVEGIACYMETLAAGPVACTLGGAEAGRMPAARHRLLADNFYVPLDELVGLGMDQLQRDSRIAPIYSQSSGLADFFMHAADGQYREPLVRYLEAIYAGRANKQTLAELTGADYPTLDREYRKYHEQLR
jgi:hypothetical protein